MRIGIDARFYGPSAKGLGRYTSELIRHLAMVDQENEYVVFLRREEMQRFTPPNERWKAIEAEFRWYSLAEQIHMPRLVRSSKVDLMHYPHFNVPIFAPRPFVVTIHDLIIAHFPTRRATRLGPIAYAIKQWGYHRVIRHAIRASERIMTISQYSKDDLVKTFGVDPNRITVTYLAVDGLQAIQPTALPQQWGITKPFFLYVGNAYPHKNLERLVAAFLDPELRSKYQLVLVGKKDYFFGRLEEEAKRIGMQVGPGLEVIFPGFVTDEQLQTLFTQARAFVFPSLYEGFGLPPLEALTRGTPVAVARATCLPEVLDDAAVFFDPLDVSDIASTLKRIATDDQLRSKIVARGQSVLKRYSWDRVARETLQVYLSVR